jgi:hypothetical protein
MIGEKIIRKIEDVKVGDDMNLRVSDGVIISKINKLNNIKKNG